MDEAVRDKVIKNLDEQLKKEGWIPASTTGGAHLKRTLEMYEELGFEVHLEEIDPSQWGGCAVCYEEGGEKMYRIFTKPKDEDEF